MDEGSNAFSHLDYLAPVFQELPAFPLDFLSGEMNASDILESICEEPQLLSSSQEPMHDDLQAPKHTGESGVEARSTTSRSGVLLTQILRKMSMEALRSVSGPLRPETESLSYAQESYSSESFDSFDSAKTARIVIHASDQQPGLDYVRSDSQNSGSTPSTQSRRESASPMTSAPTTRRTSLIPMGHHQLLPEQHEPALRRSSLFAGAMYTGSFESNIDPVLTEASTQARPSLHIPSARPNTSRRNSHFSYSQQTPVPLSMLQQLENTTLQDHITVGSPQFHDCDSSQYERFDPPSLLMEGQSASRIRRTSLPYSMENLHRRSDPKINISRRSYDESISTTTRSPRRSLGHVEPIHSLLVTKRAEEFFSLSRPLSEPTIVQSDYSIPMGPHSSLYSHPPMSPPRLPPRQSSTTPTSPKIKPVAVTSMNFGSISTALYPALIIVCEDCTSRLVCKQNPAVIKPHRSFSPDVIEQNQLCGICCGPLLAERTVMYGNDYNAVLQTKQPFWCKRCGSEFSRVDRLVSHSVTHTGKHAFPCSQCPAAFNRKARLQAHLAESHAGSSSAIKPDV